MDSDHFDANIFGHFGKARRVQIVVIPPKAHFNRDGNVDGFNGFFHDFAG